MNAKEAKKLSDKSKINGHNYQINYCLRQIKYEASLGNTCFTLDDPRVVLFEEDYKTLEKLGYKVYKPALIEIGVGYHRTQFGAISW